MCSSSAVQQQVDRRVVGRVELRGAPGIQDRQRVLPRQRRRVRMADEVGDVVGDERAVECRPVDRESERGVAREEPERPARRPGSVRAALHGSGEFYHRAARGPSSAHSRGCSAATGPKRRRRSPAKPRRASSSCGAQATASTWRAPGSRTARCRRSGARPGGTSRGPPGPTLRKRLAFQVGGKNGRERSDLWTWRPGDAQPAPIAETPRRDEAWPAWAPDAPELAFAFRGGSKPPGVAILVFRGAAQIAVPIAETSAPGLFLRPRFAPDGASLVAQRRNGGDSQLWILTRQRESRALTHDPDWFHLKAAFTRDGSRVLFTRRPVAGGPADVASVDLRGGDLRIHGSEPGSDDQSGTPSPRRDEVAFVSDRDGNFELYLAPLPEGPARRLTDTPDWDEGAPRWSPDGTRIAVTAAPHGGPAPQMKSPETLDGSRVRVIDRDGKLALRDAGAHAGLDAGLVAAPPPAAAPPRAPSRRSARVSRRAPAPARTARSRRRAAAAGSGCRDRTGSASRPRALVQQRVEAVARQARDAVQRALDPAEGVLAQREVVRVADLEAEVLEQAAQCCAAGSGRDGAAGRDGTTPDRSSAPASSRSWGRRRSGVRRAAAGDAPRASVARGSSRCSSTCQMITSSKNAAG